MSDNLLLKEWRDWIESRMARISRRVPTYRAFVTAGGWLSKPAHRPMPVWFVCANHGEQTLHFHFGLN